MLLSFKPEVFQRIQAGKKKVELRRSFPDDAVKAYMYMSSPVCAIKGIVFLGKRKALVELEQEYSRKKDIQSVIYGYMKKATYVMPINDYNETNEISLKQLRLDLDKFVVPQMYYYIENTELLKYLDNNIKISDYKIQNSFCDMGTELVQLKNEYK